MLAKYVTRSDVPHSQRLEQIFYRLTKLWKSITKCFLFGLKHLMLTVAILDEITKLYVHVRPQFRGFFTFSPYIDIHLYS